MKNYKYLSELDSTYIKHFYNFDKNKHTIEYCYANYFSNGFKLDFNENEQININILYKYFIYNYKNAVSSDYYNICILSIFSSLRNTNDIEINYEKLNYIVGDCFSNNLQVSFNTISELVQLINNQDYLENYSDTESMHSYISYNEYDIYTISDIQKSIYILNNNLHKYNTNKSLLDILQYILLFILFYCFIIISFVKIDKFSV